MDIRRIALIVGALVIAGITAFMARSMFAGAPAPQQAQAAQAPQNEVLVALKPLPVGTLIDPTAFKFQSWPKDMINPAYYDRATSLDSLNGQVVRVAVAAGQPLTRGALIQPGDRGFLAAALGPGMRAVSVPVNATSSVAGFIFPGDRVDVVLSQQVESKNGGFPLKTSETIIHNARVLATDQKTARDADPKDPAVHPFTTATLEVTPKIAEKIAVAQQIGTLSLTLRSIADNAQQLDALIASGEVQVPDSAKGDPKAERTALLAYAARPDDQNSSATVGGEVSRFQRSTVPASYAEQQAATEQHAARLFSQMKIQQLEIRRQITRKSGDIIVRRGSDAGVPEITRGAIQ